MANTKPTEELYAFWRYDCPPFVLGGKVKEIKDNGDVIINAYYPRVFTPIAILPLEKGLMLQEKINNIDAKYKAIIQNAKQELNNNIDNIKKEMKEYDINGG